MRDFLFFDGFVKKFKNLVTPVKTGVQNYPNFLDPRFCGNDEKEHNRTFYESEIIDNIKCCIKIMDIGVSCGKS